MNSYAIAEVILVAARGDAWDVYVCCLYHECFDAKYKILIVEMSETYDGVVVSNV